MPKAIRVADSERGRSFSIFESQRHLYEGCRVVDEPATLSDGTLLPDAPLDSKPNPVAAQAEEKVTAPSGFGEKSGQKANVQKEQV